MKRVHFYFALLAMTLYVTSSFGLQGRGNGGRQGAPANPKIPVVNPGGGNAGGGNPGQGNAGGGNPGRGKGGVVNPGGGGNSGGGNAGNGNAGGNSGSKSGRGNGKGNSGGVDGGNQGRGNAGGNSGATNPGQGNAGNNAGGNNGNSRDAQGFKNYGQYVAAQHVSENLGIPFNSLKAKMTGSNPVSLGQAIQELRPDLPAGSAQAAAQRAEQAGAGQGRQ